MIVECVTLRTIDVPQFLRFVDRDGRCWRVYEFSVLAGRIVYGVPGRRGSQYRGFVPEEGKPRRRYMIFKPEERRTDPKTLQLQLELSDLDWRDDPTHPLNQTT